MNFHFPTPRGHGLYRPRRALGRLPCGRRWRAAPSLSLESRLRRRGSDAGAGWPQTCLQVAAAAAARRTLAVTCGSCRRRKAHSIVRATARVTVTAGLRPESDAGVLVGRAATLHPSPGGGPEWGSTRKIRSGGGPVRPEPAGDSDRAGQPRTRTAGAPSAGAEAARLAWARARTRHRLCDALRPLRS
jgi:hypothetical protein